MGQGTETVNTCILILVLRQVLHPMLSLLVMARWVTVLGLVSFTLAPVIMWNMQLQRGLHFVPKPQSRSFKGNKKISFS